MQRLDTTNGNLLVGICGHALSTKKGDDFSFDKTCNALNILDEDYASSLLEEVGCNSTYMPYGFLDADIHINHMASFTLSLFGNTDKKVMSSFGNIQPYKKWIKMDFPPYTIVKYDDETLLL